MSELQIERTEQVTTLCLDRADRANALGPDLVEELITFFEQPTDARLIVIQGQGKTFCAGFDLRDIDDISDGDLLLRFVRVEHLLQLVYHSHTLVVCCAHRHAIGAGADLLAAASIRVISPDTSIRMPGLNFEIVLGTQRLTDLVGADAARDLLIDSRSILADEALRIGLVNQIAEQHTWPTLIDDFAERATALSPDAQARMLAVNKTDTRDADMAALVASASRPGLRTRIQSYQRQIGGARA